MIPVYNYFLSCLKTSLNFVLLHCLKTMRNLEKIKYLYECHELIGQKISH